MRAPCRTPLVLVPVPVVRRMPVGAVHVVDVVAVGHLLMPAALRVGVVAVVLGGHVLGGLALVPMTIMGPVRVPVVQVVDMVVVGDRDVATLLLVLVWVGLVLLMCHRRHCFPPVARLVASP